MADHAEWYPRSQICYPPELPAYFQNVHDLKPIVGVPSDEEIIEIHTVIHVANSLRISGLPGIHSPGLLMKLADHLFNVQMARYRSRYSLVTFPSDATYTPPDLPAHISVNLECISGAPSDNEIMKVQDAIQTYQELRRIPSMFDAHVNMELSQHLFDLQMARHMRIAGESQPSIISQPTVRTDNITRIAGHTSNASVGPDIATNDAGTKANVAGVHQTPQSTPGIGVRELIERSNQLAERFNHLLERSNELVERCNQTSTGQSSSQLLAERFNQVLERLTQLVEQSYQPGSDRLTERFNELFERFNQLAEQSHQPAQRANELAERSNELTGRANWLMEQANKPVERLGDLLKNINGVLVGIQHAIVRNHKGNTISAIDCLVNEKGEVPGLMSIGYRATIEKLSRCRWGEDQRQFPVTIDGVAKYCRIPNCWLGDFLRFYGIGAGLLRDATNVSLIDGMEDKARDRLSDYISSCLG
ncbi:unnamed protein product [Rhizoctonia solani]|uniref:Laminin domain protein n=1 Tax=Rhizoctonia solani TaxID=456999 RepID=A0A8H3GKN4_9AGAM|nr:unnamed protein product [Rhizoctonia solani]